MPSTTYILSYASRNQEDSIIFQGGYRHGGLFREPKKRCVNCHVRHFSQKSSDKSYCTSCKLIAQNIFKWWKYRKSVLRLSQSVLTATIVSKHMDTHELGLHENIMVFL